MVSFVVGGARAKTVVRINNLPYVQPGDTVSIAVSLDSVTAGLDMAGFDFMISWDRRALRFIAAQPGQLLIDCGWEYFNSRADSLDWDGYPATIPVVRVVSLADMANGDNHPTCNATSPGELAILTFEASNHPNNLSRTFGLHFVWADCGDNSMATVEGSFYISDAVFENGSDWAMDTWLPTLRGAPDECSGPGAVREIDFYNGLITMAPSDYVGGSAVSIIGEPYTWLGWPASAQIVIQNHRAPWSSSGFDLLVRYDADGLRLHSVQQGSDLLAWAWEYFQYASDSTEGLVRLVAIGDINNGDVHPSNLIDQECELATLNFMVRNDLANIGRKLSLSFQWIDCGDNTFASAPSGDSLYISGDVYDEYGFLITTDDPFPTTQGAPSECLTATTVRRSVDYYQGFIQVANSNPSDDTDRGDVNLNAVPYEVADWVLFTNYFFYGLSVFNVNIEAQIASTDVNNDGLILTLADLMYFYRIVVGDTEPIWKTGAVDDTVIIIQDTIAHTLSVTYPDSLAMLYLTFDGTMDSLHFESETHSAGYNHDGYATRVLVRPSLNYGGGVPVLPSGFLMDYIGDAMAVSAHAEYDGVNPIPAIVVIGDGAPCCVIRGNINHDPTGVLDIADLVYLVTYMFDLGPAPPCPGEADVNSDGTGDIDIADLIYLVDYMFNGGPPPVPCP